MRHKRLLAMAASLAATSLIMTGCGMNSGGGADEQPSGQSGEGQAADLTAAIAAVTDDELQGTEITMARFFGDCNETTEGVTDLDQATTECEVIQVLTNKFVAENPWGIKIERLGGTAWHSYYDGLNAALASSDRPNIAVMHGGNIPDYAARDLLVEVPEAIGIDLSDATAPAKEAAAFNGKNYGVPFDIHATLSHLNMDLLDEAGLLNDDGTYTLPTTTEDFIAEGKKFVEATGKPYLDIAMANDPMASRFFQALVVQQGGKLLDQDTLEVNMNSPEAVNALEFINQLVEAGITDKTHDYDASQQSFMRGESAIMYNGGWAVNQYTAEVPFTYEVADAPMVFDTPATWANSHIWAVPVQQDGDVVKYRAAFEFAKFLYEHTGDWAIKTGHMPTSQTALDSPEYLAAPHREQYLNTAKEYSFMPPRITQWPAVDAVLQENLETTWLNGKPVEEALSQLQDAVTNIVN